MRAGHRRGPAKSEGHCKEVKAKRMLPARPQKRDPASTTARGIQQSAKAVVARRSVSLDDEEQDTATWDLARPQDRTRMNLLEVLEVVQAREYRRLVSQIIIHHQTVKIRN